MARAAFASEGHSARALQYILESYPRDELFQISLDELYETALGILHLQERPRVRLFVRRDPYGRFLSCLVFVPRDRYNTDLRERMQLILREAINAFEVDFNVSLAESPLARIHFMARTRPEDIPAFEDPRHRSAPRGGHALLGRLAARGPHRGPRGGGRATTSRGVIERPFPRPIARTTRRAMRCTTSLGSRFALQSGTLDLHLAQAGDLADDLLVFKLYHPAVSVTLSHVLPDAFENMGVTVLDDRPYEIRTTAASVWLHAFRLRHNEARSLDTDQVSAKFQETFALVWAGVIDNDGFNRLVLRARLDASRDASGPAGSPPDPPGRSV